MNFAKAEFTLNARLEDGCTFREHLQSGWRQSGIKPDELKYAPKLPTLASHVWTHFAELHRARGSNGFGPSPLSFSDIQAWMRLTGERLDPWELRAILGIDAAYLDSVAKANKKPAGT